MGIRVSGKLGSGSDIKQAYIIFEKNVIMPLRQECENIVNAIFSMFEIPATITIKDFQIIGEEIVEQEVEKEQPKDEIVEQELNSNLRGLSAQDNMDIIRIVRDFNKGKLAAPLAKARLTSYGFDQETINEILDL